MKSTTTVVATASLEMNFEAPVPLSGTATIGADSCKALFQAHRVAPGVPLLLKADLVPEPENPKDSAAIAVYSEGQRIGYLPSYAAKYLSIGTGERLPARIQLWSAIDKDGLRVIGWIAFGDIAPNWPHTVKNPPPIRVADQNAAQAEGRRAMVREALEGADPARAAEFRLGMVAGVHYLELVEPIEVAKREGRLEDALALCYQAIQGAENDRGEREPAPGYTEHAAIVLRKMGRRDEEISVLERWLAHCPEEYRTGSKIQERLAKLLAKPQNKRNSDR
jgi:tetratricopeptide (TPR) repeat protein